MAINLEPRENGVSCIHDAFVRSYQAGLLERETDETIHYLPDDFPVSSIPQLCEMLNADLHANCTAALPVTEQVICLFADPRYTEAGSGGFGHAEFLRLSDLREYLGERSYFQMAGFIAFTGIECEPIDQALESYHVPHIALRYEPLEGLAA